MAKLSVFSLKNSMCNAIRYDLRHPVKTKNCIITDPSST